MVTRRRFGQEFKLEAVQLVKGRGVSVAQAARDLGVHENVLRKWVKQLPAEAQGGREEHERATTKNLGLRDASCYAL